ncbi:HAD family phosphatase [Streptosporangiaceae bacterium NEAU-GS5]|nr:HAD family phosphatase [Streptosporangiaceae bacterium NEAU-GS5]
MTYVIKGVLIDWGGVLTTGLAEAIQDWIAADRIDASNYRTVMIELISQAYDGGSTNIVHALERGELPVAQFEQELAAQLRTLDGGPVVAEGILNRMFAGFRPVAEMSEMLRVAKGAGLRTCLVSNSWGNDYPREDWGEMFDAVVISSEVGMRKPEPGIFEHALGLVGLPAEECVFVDDIEANVTAAQSLGLTAIHHTDPVVTIGALEALVGRPLRRGA